MAVKLVNVLHVASFCLAFSFMGSSAPTKTKASGGNRLPLYRVVTQRHGFYLFGFDYPSYLQMQTLPRFRDSENCRLGSTAHLHGSTLIAIALVELLKYLFRVVFLA